MSKYNFKAGRLAGTLREAAIGLAAQQNEDAGCNGQEGQDDAQSGNGRDECHQTGKDEPDGQQQKADIFRDSHDDLLARSQL